MEAVTAISKNLLKNTAVAIGVGLVLGLLVAVPVGIAIVVVALVRQRPSGPNLVLCPDCHGRVSRLAPTCPHCGRPLWPTGGP